MIRSPCGLICSPVRGSSSWGRRARHRDRGDGAGHGVHGLLPPDADVAIVDGDPARRQFVALMVAAARSPGWWGGTWRSKPACAGSMWWKGNESNLELDYPY